MTKHWAIFNVFIDCALGPNSNLTTPQITENAVPPYLNYSQHPNINDMTAHFLRQLLNLCSCSKKRGWKELAHTMVVVVYLQSFA